MKKVNPSIFVFFFAMIISALGFPVLPAGAAPQKPDKMEVHYLDVGQGDATLIKCGGKSMLIDAGDGTKGTAIQSYLKNQGITSLDYLVFTHPDADHIGGGPVVVTKFSIGKVFMSNYEKDNKTYRKLIQALDYKRLKYATPKVGSQYQLGTATITILGPNKTYEDPNNSSVALMVKNGNNKFLFTGDAEEEAEKDILENHLDIKADVYKAGHHGSKTSSSEAFLKAVAPACAVISCGEGNSYGFPHARVLNSLRAKGVKVYRTDEEGTIIATSDGDKITFDLPPSTTWKAGEAAPLKNQDKKELTYALNTKTKKFHRPSCASLPSANRKDSAKSRSALIAEGYSPCKRCKP